MVLRIAGALAVLMLFGGSTTTARAQEQEAETRTVTITSFFMPFNLVGDYLDYAEKYNVPVDKENPHILGFQYLVHHWGTNDPNVWVLYEYRNLGEIYQAEEWGEARFEKMFPDSAKREAIGKEFSEKFGEYYARHTDNIVAGQVKLTK